MRSLGTVTRPSLFQNNLFTPSIVDTSSSKFAQCLYYRRRRYLPILKAIGQEADRRRTRTFQITFGHPNTGVRIVSIDISVQGGTMPPKGITKLPSIKLSGCFLPCYGGEHLALPAVYVLYACKLRLLIAFW